jgi:hypothetical protein
MPFKIQKAGHTQYIEADPTNFVIRNERDILDLISGCIEYGANQVMLYEANFSPEFFDLRTTLAGTLFQKMANYHLRGAGLISFGKITSEGFKKLIFECNRGHLFRFFEDKAAAEKWLAGE